MPGDSHDLFLSRTFQVKIICIIYGDLTATPRSAIVNKCLAWSNKHKIAKLFNPMNCNNLSSLTYILVSLLSWRYKLLYLTVESLLSCCGFDSILSLRVLVDPNIIYICALSNTSLSLSLYLYIFIHLCTYAVYTHVNYLYIKNNIYIYL